MRELHLICNAHLDPVWLWQWEEGAGEAVATFRIAAELCEEFNALVFNHNEALLYQWVEEFEPALFERILRLVREKRWHIMGGWHLQPDCNLPSGEAMLRQVLLGRHYFESKFGARPQTAINFDSFGHSQGLVQILAKAGYTSYIHTRPTLREFAVPAEEYVWKGFDGTSLLVHREDGYNTRKGRALEKIEAWLAANPDKERGLLLWGIGNHGGGPSREDLINITRFQREHPELGVLHSTPEAFFTGLKPDALRKVDASLRPCFVGCYTSQAQIKCTYRTLENDYFFAEKMLSHAALAGVLPYPKELLREACRDLLFAQFHDILAGSSIQPAEEASLRGIHHGLEILARLKARAFFALAAAQPPAGPGLTPLLVYNPHPFTVRQAIEVEFSLEDVVLDAGVYFEPIVQKDGQEVASQPEREESNLPIEFRKRVVFDANLPPGQMSRYDCALVRKERRPVLTVQPEEGHYTVVTPRSLVSVNCATGLIDRYIVNGRPCLLPGAFEPLVMLDNDDPWANEVSGFPEVAGVFRLMTQEEAARFAGLTLPALPPVHVVEDGPVRIVIEALFCYGASSLAQRYFLSKSSPEVGIECRAYWNEKRSMLKLQVPTPLAHASLLGQTMFGVEKLPENGDEVVAQKWLALVDPDQDLAITCINDATYGADMREGRLRLSLLRSPGYAAMDFQGKLAMAQDRFSPRIDQGERIFRFWINAGPVDQRLAQVECEALARNERPMALAYFPPGPGQQVLPLAEVDDASVQLAAFKQAECSEQFVLRLFESTGKACSTRVRVHVAGVEMEVRLRPFEFKTYLLDAAAGVMREASPLE